LLKLRHLVCFKIFKKWRSIELIFLMCFSWCFIKSCGWCTYYEEEKVGGGCKQNCCIFSRIYQKVYQVCCIGFSGM
jgi:hypothetical protein